MFDRPDYRQITKDKVTKYHYKNLALRTEADRSLLDDTLLNVRPNIITGVNNDQFIVNIPMCYICDNMDFDVVYGLDLETRLVQLMVSGEKLEPLDDFNIHSTDVKD